jgi:hypothetical protein
MALPPRDILIDMAEDLLSQCEPTTTMAENFHQLSHRLNDSELLQLIDRLQNPPRPLPDEQPRVLWVSVD